jgi:hypothetical protein
MGEQVFTKAQYGKESTFLTAVAATMLFLGKANLPKDRTRQYPEEHLGIRARHHRSAVYQHLADGINLNVEHGYFQALPLMLSLFAKGGVTAVEETASQGDYLWDFTPSLTGDNNQDSVTLEVGDDTQAYEIAGVTGRRFKFGGSLGNDGPVNFELEGFGDKVTPTTFTSGLSIPIVAPVAANLTKLYLDTSWAGLGGTQKTGLLRDFSVEGLNGAHPKFHGDDLAMNSRGFSYFDWMVTLTIEGNSDADALFDAFRAGTPYALRLELPGSQIGTGENHRLRFDLWGEFEEVLPLDGEKDGDNLHKAIFHALYDPTGAAVFDLDVITDVSSI